MATKKPVAKKKPTSPEKAARTVGKVIGKAAGKAVGTLAARSAKASAKSELPVIGFASANDWDKWLAANHDRSPGLWLKIAKKGATEASVTYPEAVEVALRWGWIDGQKGALDDTAWLQKFTLRGPKSLWSKINREKVTQMIADGRMMPSGLAHVERAKADGRWDAAYDPPSRATVPDDLKAALAKNKKADAFFSTLNATHRYAILFQVQNAKKADTRQRRIEQFVTMLADGKTLYP